MLEISFSRYIFKVKKSWNQLETKHENPPLILFLFTGANRCSDLFEVVLNSNRKLL